jgi:hypothetical protein
MLQIQDSRVSFESGKHIAKCVCGKNNLFATRHGALSMLARGSCRYCKRDYRTTKNVDLSIYRNAIGKWCSKCSGCGKEQAYTRMDHAKQSDLRDWQCKSCVSRAKGFENNKPVGDRQRAFNKFKKSALSRGLQWSISLDEMYHSFDGACALSGWPISILYLDQTASLDRIDSSKGYTQDNIQWAHKMVNMAKNKYPQAEFIAMCNAVAQHQMVSQ